MDIPLIKRIAQRLRQTYKPLYDHTQSLLRDVDCPTGLADEIDYIYNEMVAAALIKPIDRWQSVIDFLGNNIATYSRNKSFVEQLTAHVNELRTFNEGDILASGCSQPGIVITTVHKAKGLEFDNVVVFDASDDGRSKPAERDRRLYVALSRARRRLAVYYSGWLCESIAAVSHHFDHVSRLETEALALYERR